MRFPQEIVYEINQLRHNPAYYADRLADEHVIVGDRMPNRPLYETKHFMKQLLVRQQVMAHKYLMAFPVSLVC